MALEIWHNPRCSKSRATLALIEQVGVQYRVRLYLEDPPTEEQLTDALARLALEPRHLARGKDRAAVELGLTNDTPPDGWLLAMLEHPILIERPVVLSDDGRAIIGRPPENVLELI